jgi:NAD(P)-dependent dehydrogenase (short-subunit alcohol dehydrogenase family)
MTDYRRLFDLSRKFAVVLRAASGIGKSSAKALAALGATLVCADRDGGGAETTAAGIRQSFGRPRRSSPMPPAHRAVKALADLVKAKRSRVDIAVTTHRD